LAENKRAIIVGIPGVGKTTLIRRAAEMLNQKRKTTVVIFGTIMFEEAKKMGLKHRDEMRRMSLEDQRRLQDLAAQRITEMKDDIVMIDTHLFINTDEGYYPGLPMRLLSIMKPTNMVMVAADPSEIGASPTRLASGTLLLQKISKKSLISRELWWRLALF
jgi:adenylate kinase